LSSDSLWRIGVRAAKLSSSLISRICYDEAKRVLKISFRDGRLYCYFDVPEGAFEALRDAPSAGRHYNCEIKGRYRCSYDPERRRFRPAA
jgi:hypothetical protein